MSEKPKQNSTEITGSNETNSGVNLEGDLNAIKKQQKKESLIGKIRSFLAGKPSINEVTPGQQALINKAGEDGVMRADQSELEEERRRLASAANPKESDKNVRTIAMQELEAEHGYVPGADELEAKISEVKNRNTQTTQKPLSVERVTHRYEKPEEDSAAENNNSANEKKVS